MIPTTIPGVRAIATTGVGLPGGGVAVATAHSSSPPPSANAMALCASCDRCRARKTKCDGARPCGNCAQKYMKKNKLTSIEGIDISLFECIYSPAKRRGPVPGRSGIRKAEALQNAQNAQQQALPSVQATALSADPNLHAQLAAAHVHHPQMHHHHPHEAQILGVTAAPHELHHHHAQSDLLQKHLDAQQKLAIPMEYTTAPEIDPSNMSLYNMNPQQRQQILLQQQLLSMQAAAAKTPFMTAADPTNAPHDIYVTSQDKHLKTSIEPRKPLPRTVATHSHLLEKSNVDGNRLRSYYNLSIDELLNLPPIPSDEEYCSRLPVPMKPQLLPRFDVAALQAARFSEIALGALANNQVPVALELSNATVMCLRECVEEPVHPSCMLDVARAYFLHGMFRSFRGDLERYFKYRRVALTHLSQLDNVSGVESLLAAMSFHDSWAYMIHNASTELLPNIDDVIPPLPPIPSKPSASQEKYGVSSIPSAIASHPDNQMWIQGPPPIFINNKAPPLGRSLDGLACAIRSCCDKANQDMTNKDMQNTPTTTAVMANQNELCPRNMVLSAFTLLQMHEASTEGSIKKNHGHHLIISAMDAFLEGGDEEEPGGFTDSQIQSLLSVCNTVIEHPLLLHQPGPTYHMVSNAAILLCHLLNGMYSQKQMQESQNQNNMGVMDNPTTSMGAGDMEAALFEEVLDTFLSIRKLLNIHRRKLPMRLRCHAIPRPKYNSPNEFIDLSDTILCSCKGCQGFVLMACSPCVAAERAAAAHAEAMEELSSAIEMGEGETNEEKELNEIGSEFDLDDDALLNVLSRIIST